jgi:ribosomal protein L7Ae-like RNA K-turn-binding protein
MMEKRDITLSAEAQKKVLGVIGLARRARRLVAGTQIVCDSLKEQKALFVAVASDASENTKKRLFDRCAFYEKQIIILPVSSEELGAAIGRGGACAAVALTDASFVNAFAKAAGVEIQKL